MDREVSQRQPVLRLVQDSFDFLRAAGASCEVISAASQDSVTFVLPDFFIEVEIDWREQAVFTLLGELAAGKIPDGYYTDSAGKTRRWHLAQLLEHGEWPQDLVGIRQAVSQTGPSAMAAQIAAYSSAIRHALDEIPRMLKQVAAA